MQCCEVPLVTSLRYVKFFSLNQFYQGIIYEDYNVDIIQIELYNSLSRHEQVCLIRQIEFLGFIYVPMRRCKGVSNRSVLFLYQLRRRDDVSACSRDVQISH